MTDYIQARPSTGFLIHAVPAENRRSGLKDQYIGGRTICDRVVNRDVWGSPTLTVLRDNDRREIPFTVGNVTDKTCVRCHNRLARQLRKEAA